MLSFPRKPESSEFVSKPLGPGFRRDDGTLVVVSVSLGNVGRCRSAKLTTGRKNGVSTFAQQRDRLAAPPAVRYSDDTGADLIRRQLASALTMLPGMSLNQVAWMSPFRLK